MIYRYSDKDPSELLTLAVDFTDLLSGETISQATWAISREDAVEDTAAMLVGNIDISNAPIVRQRVSGGTVGGKYIHRVSVTTSTGRVLVQGVRQKVVWGA